MCPGRLPHSASATSTRYPYPSPELPPSWPLSHAPGVGEAVDTELGRRVQARVTAEPDMFAEDEIFAATPTDVKEKEAAAAAAAAQVGVMACCAQCVGLGMRVQGGMASCGCAEAVRCSAVLAVHSPLSVAPHVSLDQLISLTAVALPGCRRRAPTCPQQRVRARACWTTTTMQRATTTSR